MIGPFGERAAVSLRDREAEEAQIGDAGDDVVRHILVAAVDLLRTRGDPLGGEVPQRGPEQPVLGGRAQVVRAAARKKKSGNGFVGRVEGLGAAVGCRRGCDRDGKLVAGPLSPRRGCRRGCSAGGRPGRLVGLYLADVGLQGRAFMPKAAPRSATTAAIFRDASSIISSPSITAPVCSTSVAVRYASRIATALS